MPRRRVLTARQLEALFALPTAGADLIRHFTLSPEDLAVIARRRQPHNRLGFALQLCALRFPGRLIRPGELVPLETVAFVAEQVDVDPATLAAYAQRAPTRYEHLEALRKSFGFRTFSHPDHRELSVWLVPVALSAVKGLARDDGPDYLTLAAANHALLRRAGPLFLEAFEFKGAAAVAGFLRAVAAMRLFYAGNRRTLPKDIPTDFIRRSWRPAVFRDGVIDGPAYELCLFAELRDRLRAGDVWVVGSRQYRAVEDQLIPKPLFAEMRAAGPLPVAVPLEAAGYLRERKALLATRLRERLPTRPARTG